MHQARDADRNNNFGISCIQVTPKRYERRKSFRNSRETIGITSNTVDTPVTASRKQLIQQVIHLEIQRNIAREEFEESEGARRLLPTLDKPG